MTTMEQVDLQLQQEPFALKAQVAARFQIAAASLEWSTEQMTEISTEFIDREFLPIRTNQERGAQQSWHSTRGSHELRSERHCCQLAEEPVGGMAKTAEEA